MLDRRLRLLEEAAGLPDELAVRVDLALGAQVADEVPVQPRPVLPAEVLGTTSPSATCIVPPIFSSKSVLLREPVDLVVEAERDLAEPARALVQLEQRVEVLAPRASASAATTRPPSKRSRTSSTSRPWKSAGNVKRDLALGDGLERAREDLAVRHVVAAVRGLPASCLRRRP